MESILSWIYKQKIRITFSNETELIKEADFLGCHEVVDKCPEFIISKLDTDNVIELHRFCGKFNFAQLETRFLRFIEYDFERVSQSEIFLK